MTKTSWWVVILVIAAAVLGLIVYNATNEDDASVSETDSSAVETATEDTVTTKKMDEQAPTEDVMQKAVTNTVITGLEDIEFQHEGDLADVSGGTATGTARAGFNEGNYTLHATFVGLPEPEGTDFYEGWVVRKGADFDVISTGKVDKVNGVYENVYRSEQDLTDHSFYVLTIEPDDGDPAPAGHIVEGDMTQVAQVETAGEAAAASAQRKGDYVNYDESRLSDANDGKVVLFFHAAWCPTCTVAEADIVAKKDEIPTGATIMKVDYDTATALKRKHSVVYQHTFVQVDANGDQLKKWSGGGLDTLKAQLQ